MEWPLDILERRWFSNDISPSTIQLMVSNSTFLISIDYDQSNSVITDDLRAVF